jgi:GR25 family glycosyltransferase involved in LPS biosynthesis
MRLSVIVLIIIIGLILSLSLSVIIIRISELFGQTSQMNGFFINLEVRKDRYNQFIEEFKSLTSLNMQLFKAISTPSDGAYGCCQSHLGAVESAKKKGYPIVFIAEDDFQFITDPESAMAHIDKALNYFSDTGTPWDVLMLSASSGTYKPVTPFISRVVMALTATGYIVNSHYYDTLIGNYRETIKTRDREKEAGVKLSDISQAGYVDTHWHELMAKDNWYILDPIVAKQRESYSDIEKLDVDYSNVTGQGLYNK